MKMSKLQISNFKFQIKINHQKDQRSIVNFFMGLFLLLPLSALAGSLDSPATPTDAGSAMYTLSDIYNRLNAGTAGTKRFGAFTEPAAGPASTGNTLDEVMGKAPAVDDTDGLTPSETTSGKTFWGLKSGTWGFQTGSNANVVDTTTGDAVAGEILSGKKAYVDGSGLTGTMSNNGTVNITPGTSSQAIAAGYHNGSGSVAGDAALLSTNIKSGVTIFSVAGDSNVVDTTTGDAAAADILSGKKAYVDGSEITGSIATQTLADTSTIVSAGYYAATALETVDSDLTAGNINGGTVIFGITGTLYSPVEETGQTTCYAGDGSVIADCSGVGVGQDGDLKKGVAWPTPERFTASNGTVTDNLTGLIWLQDASCIDVLGGVSFSSEQLDWEEALTWSNAMVGDGSVCNLTDGSIAGAWRLPNVKELQSLIDFAFYNPALSNAAGTAKWTDGDPFTGVQSNVYWSSTTYSNGATGAWYLTLNDGNMNSGNKANDRYVWPVRGGQ